MGRPKLPETKVNKSVTISREALEELTKLGKGNLSAGIEMVYRWSKEEVKEENKKASSVNSLDNERYGKSPGSHGLFPTRARGPLTLPYQCFFSLSPGSWFSEDCKFISNSKFFRR